MPARPNRKTQCEECVQLDVRRLLDRQSLTPGQHWRDIITFTTPLNESAATLECDTTGAAKRCILSYRLNPFTLWIGKPDDPTPVAYSIVLETTPQRVGGVRHWFTCPGVRDDGRPCGKRCCILYLPRGEKYFLCRACHALNYRSSQRCNSRKRHRENQRIKW